jgi:hypothetical protein
MNRAARQTERPPDTTNRLNCSAVFQWKLNVLNFMRNNYQESFKPYVVRALDNPNDKIRESAESICKEQGITA